MHIHTHVHAHTCTCTHMYMHTHVHVHTHMYVCIYLHIHNVIAMHIYCYAVVIFTTVKSGRSTHAPMNLRETLFTNYIVLLVKLIYLIRRYSIVQNGGRVNCW